MKNRNEGKSQFRFLVSPSLFNVFFVSPFLCFLSRFRDAEDNYTEFDDINDYVDERTVYVVRINGGNI